jgi:Predicted deacetylase
MSGRVLVSVSSIFDQTREAAAATIADLSAEGIEVSLLVAPRINGTWRLSRDDATRDWLVGQREAGRELILNGFDQPAQGRRAEFATLEQHEARLRLTGAVRQMTKIGFTFSAFAPPRWRMSEGTLDVLPEFGFTVAASTNGLHDLRAGRFLPCRNLSVGEGFGAAKWWRRNIIQAAHRGATRGNTIRLSASARNLGDPRVARDFMAAAVEALEAGCQPQTYMSVFNSVEP